MSFKSGGQLLRIKRPTTETICYSIDKLNKPHLVSTASARFAIDSAQQIANTQGFHFYRHAKTGNLAIAGLIDKRIKRDGSAVDVMAIYQPVSSRSWHKLDLPDFEKVWIPEIPTNQYWKQWQQLIDLAPEFERERIYLICGLLLPVWKQLPDSNPKVFRLQMNDGRILLGRAIDPHQIEKVFSNFGLKDLIKLNAEYETSRIFSSND